MFRLQTAKRRLFKTRLKTAKEVQKDRLLHDPIEDDDRYADLLKAAKEQTGGRLKGKCHGMGFCHFEWTTMQTILLEEFGVIWFSPREMNPGTSFD